MNYKVKESHRIEKSVNVCLCDEDGSKLYDRYVATDAWDIDSDEVASELIVYWEKESEKIQESVILPELPVEVIMTTDEALVKQIAVQQAKIAAVIAAKELADGQAEDKKIEMEGQ